MQLIHQFSNQIQKILNSLMIFMSWYAVWSSRNIFFGKIVNEIMFGHNSNQYPRLQIGTMMIFFWKNNN